MVFISNPTRAAAMWHQRAAGRPDRPIVWDYHVIVLAHDPMEIWDLDTSLDLPTPALTYLRRSFPPGVPPRYHPRFRIVDAAVFAEAFASDRSHMKLRSGRHKKPPPPWPPIGAPDRLSNLVRFVDMEAPYLGEVIDLPEMLARTRTSSG